MIYENLAVIIRGHIRTWHYTKEVNFKIFETIAKNIDYYFVTWDLPYNHKRIFKDFKKRNLIKYLTVPIKENYYNYFQGIYWLDHNILPFKRERDKEINYDAIIVTRPDIILSCSKDKLVFPKTNEIYCDWFKDVFNTVINRDVPEMCDYLGVMCNNTYEILTTKHLFEYKLDKGECGHQNLRRFYKEKNINVKLLNGFLSPILVRPLVLDLVSNPLKFHTDLVDNVYLIWNQLSDKEKLDICIKHNIPAYDYHM